MILLPVMEQEKLEVLKISQIATEHLHHMHMKLSNILDRWTHVMHSDSYLLAVIELRHPLFRLLKSPLHWIMDLMRLYRAHHTCLQNFLVHFVS